jgi:hypothetical protein
LPVPLGPQDACANTELVNKAVKKIETTKLAASTEAL